MNKGARKVIATSPHGATTIIEGKALWLARQCSSQGYITVHEGPVSNDPLVGIIPDSWAIELILNNAT